MLVKVFFAFGLIRYSLGGSLSHATHFMRVSLTIRIQVSIPHYASVLVFCMMDIWMFSLAKICRHASRGVFRAVVSR